jgi:hypothetical protein
VQPIRIKKYIGVLWQGIAIHRKALPNVYFRYKIETVRFLKEVGNTENGRLPKHYSCIRDSHCGNSHVITAKDY